MKTTLIMTLGMALAMCAGSLPAFADGPNVPQWSGAPIAIPGDEGTQAHSTGLTHYGPHGNPVTHSRG